MEWKDVKGYEGIYEVSNTGEIRSKEGKETYGAFYGKRVWKSRIMKQKTNKKGEKIIELYKNGSSKYLRVHRLVAKAFLPNKWNRPKVKHIDGDKSNNHVENLEWIGEPDTENKGAIKTILTNLETGEEHEFDSMTQASKFLGKKPSHISDSLKRGINKRQGFLITREIK